MKTSGHILWAILFALPMAGCNQTQPARLAYSGHTQQQISQWRSQSASMDSRSQAAYLAEQVSGKLPNQRLNGCARAAYVPRGY